MNTKKIIQLIAKNKYTKYVQAIEIASFIIGGYLTYTSFFNGFIMLIIGIFAAVIASESAIEEYRLKIGERKIGSS